MKINDNGVVINYIKYQQIFKRLGCLYQIFINKFLAASCSASFLVSPFPFSTKIYYETPRLLVFKITKEHFDGNVLS
jgi:hypothetical protein